MEGNQLKYGWFSFLLIKFGEMVILLGKRKSKADEILEHQKRLAQEELENAKKELFVAEFQFNQCEEVFFEVANQQLTIAKDKLNLAILKSKLINQSK